MKEKQTFKVMPWEFKNNDDILDPIPIRKCITCLTRYRDGDTVIILPSKLNGQSYSEYGKVKNLPLWDKSMK